MKEATIPFQIDPQAWQKSLLIGTQAWHSLDCLLWGSTKENCPITQMAICHDRERFHVVMRSYETELRYETNFRNGPVYEDSCMEFFFSPCPEISRGYCNFEINPLGAMLIGISETGSKKDHRRIEAPDNPYFRMQVFPSDPSPYRGPFGMIFFSIPFSWIQKSFPRFTPEQAYITGNFYKCGDKTAHPHYCSWNNIISSQPNYHKPECFGKLILMH